MFFSRSSGVTWLLLAAVFFLDFFTPANVIIPLLYLFLPYARVGDQRKSLWLVATTSASLTLLEPFIGAPPTLGSNPMVVATNRLLIAGAILISAYFIHARLAAESSRDKALDELTDAVRARDVFLATLAHELRNPLSSLSNGIGVLQHSRGNQAGNLITMMDRQVRLLVRLVDDLLDVSRIQGGPFRLRRETVDVRDVVHSAVETCKPSFEEAGQHLIESVEESVVTVEADPLRLTQAITNLLDNASKYTPAGGRIAVSVKHEHACVHISVRDDGRGISQAALPSIFNLFSRETQTGSIKGLGIGLALVRQIAELHGGSVEAHSDGPGRGSEFVLTLPKQLVEAEMIT